MPCDFFHRTYTQLIISSFYFLICFPPIFFKSYSLKAIFYFCFVAFLDEHIDDNKTLQKIIIRIIILLCYKKLLILQCKIK